MTSPAKGYQRMPEPGNPTRTEAWALLEAARELNQTRNGPQDEFLRALRRNWRLWTIFQANLLDEECQVPPAIRANLLGLADFIDRQTAALLAQPEPSKVDVLVNINRQISEGLLDGMRAGVARAAAQSQSVAELRQSA